MSEEQLEVLREISQKLDQLIILTKLTSEKLIKEHKRKVQKDKIASKILEYSDGSLSYSDLAKRVAEELGVAEITVKRKIPDLKEMGFLIGRRRGRTVYYENSGLFE